MKKSFVEYIEQLAMEHKSIGHSRKECHFSDMAEETQNAISHMKMNYPCVVVDVGDVEFSGSSSQPYENDMYSLLFLDHVKDTGDPNEIREVFHRMKTIAKDFLKRFDRDRKSEKVMSRFDITSVKMGRVYLEDAALYGYAVLLTDTSLFVNLDCNNVWEEDTDGKSNNG